MIGKDASFVCRIFRDRRARFGITSPTHFGWNYRTVTGRRWILHFFAHLEIHFSRERWRIIKVIVFLAGWQRSHQCIRVSVCPIRPFGLAIYRVTIDADSRHWRIDRSVVSFHQRLLRTIQTFVGINGGIGGWRKCRVANVHWMQWRVTSQTKVIASHKVNCKISLFHSLLLLKYARELLSFLLA